MINIPMSDSKTFADETYSTKEDKRAEMSVWRAIEALWHEPLASTNE